MGESKPENVRDLGWSQADTIKWCGPGSVAQQMENPEPTIDDLIEREKKWIEGSNDPNRPTHEYALRMLESFSAEDRQQRASDMLKKLEGK